MSQTGKYIQKLNAMEQDIKLEELILLTLKVVEPFTQEQIDYLLTKGKVSPREMLHGTDIMYIATYYLIKNKAMYQKNACEQIKKGERLGMLERYAFNILSFDDRFKAYAETFGEFKSPNYVESIDGKTLKQKDDLDESIIATLKTKNDFTPAQISRINEHLARTEGMLDNEKLPIESLSLKIAHSLIHPRMFADDCCNAILEDNDLNIVQRYVFDRLSTQTKKSIYARLLHE